jgi:hypothetical protein
LGKKVIDYERVIRKVRDAAPESKRRGTPDRGAQIRNAAG